MIIGKIEAFRLDREEFLEACCSAISSRFRTTSTAETSIVFFLIIAYTYFWHSFFFILIEALMLDREKPLEASRANVSHNYIWQLNAEDLKKYTNISPGFHYKTSLSGRSEMSI